MRFYNQPHRFYCGVDLHARTLSLCVLDAAGNTVLQQQVFAIFRDDYKLLFLQGGATMHFAGVPMNILGSAKSADYVNTGEWSKKAMSEAKKFCAVNVAGNVALLNLVYGMYCWSSRLSWETLPSPPSCRTRRWKTWTLKPSSWKTRETG